MTNEPGIEPTFDRIQWHRSEVHSLRAGFIRATLDAARVFAQMARTHESPERRNDLLARARAGYDAALRSYRHKPELTGMDWQPIAQEFEVLCGQLGAFDAAELPLPATSASLQTMGSEGRHPAPARANSEGRNGRDPRLATLTAREIQVLTLIGEGKRTKEIAFELGITFKTAVTHRSNIMEKLDIHEGPRLVRFAIRTGLCEP